MYNINWTNITGVYDVVRVSNDATDNFLMSGFIIAIFFVILLSLKRNDNDIAECLVVASWLSFIISLLARYAELVSLYTAIIFLIVASISTMYMVMSKR